MNKEIARRRTFAIISHPDAGKTTLTEKLLLYGGALELAGSVTARKKQRDTSSDWMELEKKRGISISSTVLQFEYRGFKFNLLDTPGHKDFSEDTYRVLTAVDGVIMVIDAAKGIESQTIKLFEICKKRGVPIFTYMNKMDRPAKSPLELIDQLEDVLGIHAFPVNWPIESGVTFKGIYDRLEKQVHLFERVPGGSYKAPVSVHNLSDSSFKKIMHEDVYNTFMEEIEMLDYAHEGFDSEAVLKGETTPVFFGSAANNFGVELLLNGFLKYSSPPVPMNTKDGLLPLEHPAFSAFIFKVQTNMNPQHRDRMVFARVCSGKFERDIKVFHTASGKEIRLSSTHAVFGRDRETLNEAYPGDILGFVTTSHFKIGDTLSSDKNIIFQRIPRFAPECFAYVQNTSTSNYKAFRKGLDHLISEDIVQTFTIPGSPSATPLLGAVGPLQFEVFQHRLKEEYGVESILEMKPWTILRWLENPVDPSELDRISSYGFTHGLDDQNRQILLFESPWALKNFEANKSDYKLIDINIDL